MGIPTRPAQRDEARHRRRTDRNGGSILDAVTSGQDPLRPEEGATTQGATDVDPNDDRPPFRSCRNSADDHRLQVIIGHRRVGRGRGRAGESEGQNKCDGSEHPPPQHAPTVTRWCCAWLTPAVNFRHPCTACSACRRGDLNPHDLTITSPSS